MTHVRSIFGIRLGAGDPVVVTVSGRVSLRPLQVPNITVRQTGRPIDGPMLDLPAALRALVARPDPRGPRALEAPHDTKTRP